MNARYPARRPAGPAAAAGRDPSTRPLPRVLGRMEEMATRELREAAARIAAASDAATPDPVEVCVAWDLSGAAATGSTPGTRSG